MPESNDAAVIGGGPAGLMAAETLAASGVRVTVYDRMPSLGRKFLLAGRGGLNLTHSEPLDGFMMRYGAAAPALREAIAAFSPAALRAWCESLGQPTFVGSSGRVFPAAMKSSPLLRAWLRRLDGLGVRIATRHAWTGWNAAGRLTFSAPEGDVAVAAKVAVLALGGASWPRLGSDGGWVEVLREAGMTVAPLQPANCGVQVDWSEHVKERFAGHPLKRIAVLFEGKIARGEAVVTAQGLEGSALYALAAALRAALATRGEADLAIDLRPDLTLLEIERRLAQPRSKQSMATFLRKSVALSPVAIGLIQETLHRDPQAQRTPSALAAMIKSLPLRITGLAGLSRAISTAGGVAFCELDASFMLRRRPGVFVAGEMLDWEAPTGGYLLQACFATGRAAGCGALAWLAKA